jgi:NarL family two-component system response regulator LiaR
MTEQITVLIVDDHQVVRQGVRTFLEAQADITVVAEAESGEIATQLAAEYAPDVVLIDLLMPGMDGVIATQQVKQASPRTQIIVLTSYHQNEHIFPAIRAGALSYLLKDTSPQELIEAVRKAARGEVVLHSRVAARVIQELYGVDQDTPDPLTTLSEREMDVLRLVADGLSNVEIAEQLTISDKTVKSHVSNILSKLHLADRTQAAVFAWREGVMRRDFEI